MEPLSRRTRYTYLALLILTFIVLVPVTVLYSSGYRLGEHFTLVKTGGIYIGSNQSGASLFLDNEFVRGAGILKQGFFVQDLVPGTYTISVKKDGYYAWEKTLNVRPQHVVEASAFMLPQDIPFAPIPEFIETGTTDRVGTARMRNPEYAAVRALFATTTTATSANPQLVLASAGTTTETERVGMELKKKGDIALWRAGGAVRALWVADSARAPLYFCDSARACGKEIILSTERVTFFDFYPEGNELAILTLPRGIFVVEIDDRSIRNTQPLYQSEGASFRIVNDTVFIEDGGSYFSVEL